jgi:hypothetical protein
MVAPAISRARVKSARARRAAASGVVLLCVLFCAWTTAAWDERPAQDATQRATQSAEPAPKSASYFSFFDGWEREPYELDELSRFVEPGERVRCDAKAMVSYRSRALRYGVRVHPAFRERLTRFDALVVDLATSHYGRPPRRLVHHGSFACRSLRSRKERISEHALGNALDLKGFDFGPLPKRAQLPEGMPKGLRSGFSVRVLDHWTPRRTRDHYHARFLHQLTEALRHRPDIFRGIVGPPRPRHHDHLHLDAAPWRYAMFGYGSEGDPSAAGPDS